MSTLVKLQTLRGTAGVATMQDAVTKAVAKASPDHAVEFLEALPANTKGMQCALSLWAALARANGATAIRLGVHQGYIALCGPRAAVDATIAAFTPTLSAVKTAAANAYTGTEGQGARMAFMNAYTCGLCAAIDAANAPATVAYGLGGLHEFPAPGNGTAYGQAAKAPAPYAAPAPAPAPAKPMAKAAKVA